MNQKNEEEMEIHNYFDLIFFGIIFLIVLYLLLPGILANLPIPYVCSRNNGNFSACVSAQRAGKGCAWNASCQSCINETGPKPTNCK